MTNEQHDELDGLMDALEPANRELAERILEIGRDLAADPTYGVSQQEAVAKLLEGLTTAVEPLFVTSYEVPRLARRIELVRHQRDAIDGGTFDLVIDGKPFPWVVSPENPVLTVGGSTPRITVTILAEAVVVVDSLGTYGPDTNQPVVPYADPELLASGRRIENTEIHDRLAGKGQ